MRIPLNNKLILLTQKGFYPYNYMVDWDKPNKLSLLEKEDFDSHINMENINDVSLIQIKSNYK